VHASEPSLPRGGTTVGTLAVVCTVSAVSFYRDYSNAPDLGFSIFLFIQLIRVSPITAAETLEMRSELQNYAYKFSKPLTAFPGGPFETPDAKKLKFGLIIN